METPAANSSKPSALDPAPMLPTMISLNTSMHSRRLHNTVVALIAIATALCFFAGAISAQKRRSARHGAICGGPTVPCKTSATFPPNDLPFRVPATANIYDTDLFYPVMLKSLSVSEGNCHTFVPD